MTTSALPSNYLSGKVVGRIVRAIADTPGDPDFFPEAIGAQGTVTFEPLQRNNKVTVEDYPALVIHETISVTLSRNGSLSGPYVHQNFHQNPQGIWLVTGSYEVRFSLDSGTIPPFLIEVTTDHTEENPLDLAHYIPTVPPVGALIQQVPLPIGGPGALIRQENGTLGWKVLEAAQAEVQGFWPVYSENPPEATTQHGVPVVWMRPPAIVEPVPVIPPMPLWSDVHTTVTIPPDVVGVEYRDELGRVLLQGAAIHGTKGQEFTVTAHALPGYALPTEMVWKHFFPDEALETLVASDSFDGPASFTLVGRELDNALGGTRTIRWQEYEGRLNPYWRPPHLNWLGGGEAGFGLTGDGSLTSYSAPSIDPTLSTSGTGGTLPDATYYYMVTALLELGETGCEKQKSVTTSGGGTSVNTLSWPARPEAVGFRVWRGDVSGRETLLATLPPGTTDFNDEGSQTPGTETPPYYRATGTGSANVTLGSQWQRCKLTLGGDIVVANSVVVRFRCTNVTNPYVQGYFISWSKTSVTFGVGVDEETDLLTDKHTYNFSHSWQGEWNLSAIGTSLTAVSPTGVTYTATMKPFMPSTSLVGRIPGETVILGVGPGTIVNDIKFYEVG